MIDKYGNTWLETDFGYTLSLSDGWCVVDLYRCADWWIWHIYELEWDGYRGVVDSLDIAIDKALASARLRDVQVHGPTWREIGERQ